MGFVFTEQASSPTLGAVAGSSDVSFLIGVSTVDGYIHTSDDGGANWTVQSLQLDPDPNYHSIACDATGQYVVASTTNSGGTGALHRSTDYGETWGVLTSAGVKNWTWIASSSDGTKLVAVDFGSGSGGSIWTSTDSGANWTERTGAGSLEWQMVSCSNDGTKILAGSGSGIWYSSDSGANWTDQSEMAGFCVKVSPDGSVLLQWDIDGQIVISTNDGVDWTNISTGVSQSSAGIAMSPDGSLIIVPGYGGDIHTSTDFGSNWTTLSAAVAENAEFIALDSTGTQGYLSTTFDPGYTFVFSALSITSITPNTGSTAGGTPVTIVGVGFDPAATAAIDDNDLTDVIVVDSTTITGITPAGTVGAKDVTVTNP